MNRFLASVTAFSLGTFVCFGSVASGTAAQPPAAGPTKSPENARVGAKKEAAEQPAKRTTAKRTTAKTPGTKTDKTSRTKTGKKTEKVARDKLLIRKLMGAVHQGNGAPLAILKAEVKQKEPNWERIKKSAQFIEVMSLALPDKKGAYSEGANLLRTGVKEKSLAKTAKAVTAISRSCSSCHGWGAGRR